MITPDREESEKREHNEQNEFAESLLALNRTLITLERILSRRLIFEILIFFFEIFEK